MKETLTIARGCMECAHKAIGKLKRKRETKSADQNFQDFANFFEVRGVRDKRREEMKLVSKGKGKRVTMEVN